MKKKPKILFVDDEGPILMGLRRVLNSCRSKWELHFTQSPKEAMVFLQKQNFAAVVCDMRMPQINGAQLLNWVREKKPETVRLLLTGQAGLQDAISAINNGQIFRFLTKPCPPDTLKQTIQQAVEYHFYLADRRDLLINMFDSSIRIMCEMFEMTDPKAFQDATNRRALIVKLSDLIDINNISQVKIAALLSRVGEMGMPEELRKRAQEGGEFTPEEKQKWDTIPEMGYNLIKDAPRLQVAANLVRYQAKNYDGTGFPKGTTKHGDIPQGARILKILGDIAELERRKLSIPEIFANMDTRQGHYDPELYAKIKEYHVQLHVSAVGNNEDCIKLRVEQLSAGLKLQAPLLTKDDVLLFPSGTVLTPANVVAIENWHKSRGVREPIKIVSQAEAAVS